MTKMSVLHFIEGNNDFTGCHARGIKTGNLFIQRGKACLKQSDKLGIQSCPNEAFANRLDSLESSIDSYSLAAP